MHAPAAHQRTPFGGVDRLISPLIAHEQTNSPKLKTLKAKASYILPKGVSHLGLPIVLRFLVDSFGHLQTQLFEKLFVAMKSVVKTAWSIDLPRRITVRMPSYSEAILRNVGTFVRKSAGLFIVPKAPKACL